MMIRRNAMPISVATFVMSLGSKTGSALRKFVFTLVIVLSEILSLYHLHSRRTNEKKTQSLALAQTQTTRSHCHLREGVPRWHSCKEPPADVEDTGDTGPDPWVGKILWRRA